MLPDCPSVLLKSKTRSYCHPPTTGYGSESVPSLSLLSRFCSLRLVFRIRIKETTLININLFIGSSAFLFSGLPMWLQTKYNNSLCECCTLFQSRDSIDKLYLISCLLSVTLCYVSVMVNISEQTVVRGHIEYLYVCCLIN
jgi:hypothetical protein